MPYEIHLKEVPPEHVATRRVHTPLASLGDAMSATLSQIGACAAPCGAPFAIYHGQVFVPEDIDVELGFPVAADASVPSSAAATKDLPGGAVAHTLHVGPYGAIGAAYDALYTWVAAHGLRPSGPPREIYLVGPAPGTSESQYRTEIVVPITPSRGPS